MKKLTLLAFCVVFLYSAQAQIETTKRETRPSVYRQYLHNMQMRRDSMTLYDFGKKTHELVVRFIESTNYDPIRGDLYLTKQDKADWDNLWANKSLKDAIHRLDSVNGKKPTPLPETEIFLTTTNKIRVEGEKKLMKFTAIEFTWPVMNYDLAPLGWVNVQGREIYYYSKKDKEALLEVLAPYHPVRIGVSENYTVTRFEEYKYFGGWNNHILYKANGIPLLNANDY